MNKPVFQERISQKIYFFEFDLGRCDTRLFGLLKVKKNKLQSPIFFVPIDFIIISFTVPGERSILLHELTKNNVI